MININELYELDIHYSKRIGNIIYTRYKNMTKPILIKLPLLDIISLNGDQLILDTTEISEYFDNLDKIIHRDIKGKFPTLQYRSILDYCTSNNKSRLILELNNIGISKENTIISLNEVDYSILNNKLSVIVELNSLVVDDQIVYVYLRPLHLSSLNE